MKKLNRKSIIVALVVAVCVLAAAGYVTAERNGSKCTDIIGDGYAMGTDPQPVVIGNTCDQ
jgi:hypothetical protein